MEKSGRMRLILFLVLPPRDLDSMHRLQVILHMQRVAQMRLEQTDRT